MSYFIQHLLRQAATLPAEVRTGLDQRYPGESILMYAFSDLDSRLSFCPSWAVCTDRRLVVCETLPTRAGHGPQPGTAKPLGDPGSGMAAGPGSGKDGLRAAGTPAPGEDTAAVLEEWSFRDIVLENLDRFELQDGLSLTVLAALDKEGMVFHTFRYSRRQSRAMGNVQFAAEQKARLLRQLQTAAVPGAAAPTATTATAASSGAAPAPEESMETRSAAPGHETPGTAPGSGGPGTPPQGTEKDGTDLVSGPIAADQEYTEAMHKGVEESSSLVGVRRLGLIKRLLGLMLPWKGAMVGALVASFFMTIISLFPPILSRILIDDVLRPLERKPEEVAWGLLGTVILLVGLIYMFQEVFQFVRLRFMAVTGEKVVAKMRQDVYDKLQTLSLSYFHSHPTGSLISRVSSDTDRLWDFMTFGFLDAIIAVITIIGVAIALMAQDVWLALVVLIPVPFMTVLFFIHGQRQHHNFHRIWRRWSAMTAVLSDVIPGMRVVKAFAREERESQRFKEKNHAVQDEAIRLHREWTLFWPFVVMFIHAANVLIWILGVPRVIEHIQTGGAQGLPLGVFIAFQGYVWMFWGPVQQLGMLSRTLNRVTSSAARVFEVLDTKPTITSKPGSWAPGHFEGKVEFRNVCFTYDGIRNVLKGVDFEVKPGEMIGLVGPSGGGKTTMTNLICRFYEVKEGSILIDGVDVRDMDLASLRRRIGVVLQEPYLFHGTIADNIAYGAEAPSLKEIIEAAKAANAHDFICGFADGYETLVGERGQTLSGGERQRISIARAILHKPSILILDEATSSVDTETEKRIQEALHRLTAGRTTFAIAHRLSTLSSADRLFVMEGGKLVEQGSHQELLALENGVYAKLHRTQVEMQAAIAI